VFENRVYERFSFCIDLWAILRGFVWILRIKAMKTLADVPAIVAAFDNNVHFLEHRLSNLTSKQLVIAATIERHAPGVANAPSEDLGAAFFTVGKGVISGDRVRIPVIHIDSENLAQER